MNAAGPEMLCSAKASNLAERDQAPSEKRQKEASPGSEWIGHVQMKKYYGALWQSQIKSPNQPGTEPAWPNAFHS